MTLLRRIVLSALGLGTLLATAPAAIANAPPPPGYRERKGPELVVQPSNDKVSRLSIPKKLIPAGDKKTEKSEADDTGNFSGGRTVVAGVAMSAAVALLGLHLVRRRSGRGLAPVILIGAGACAMLGATALADLAVPGGIRKNRPGPPPRDPPGTVTTPLVIEWTDDGDNVKLSLSPEQLQQLVPGGAGEKKPAEGSGSAPAK